MRQASRATLYRQRSRRLKGQRAQRLGRRRISLYQHGRDAALLREAAMFIRRGRMRPMANVHDDLESSGLPAALLAVAAWDVCKPVERKRAADKLRVESMAKKFAARYEGRVSISEARQLVAKAIANGEEWVSEFTVPDRPSTEWEPRTGACPSAALGLSRRMIFYWRHHRSYRAACALVRRLWRDAAGD